MDEVKQLVKEALQEKEEEDAFQFTKELFQLLGIVIVGIIIKTIFFQ